MRDPGGRAWRGGGRAAGRRAARVRAAARGTAAGQGRQTGRRDYRRAPKGALSDVGAHLGATAISHGDAGRTGAPLQLTPCERKRRYSEPNPQSYFQTITMTCGVGRTVASHHKCVEESTGSTGQG